MNSLPTAKIKLTLTDSQERFAVHYATYGDPVAAYQHAYDPTTTRRASLQQLAYRVRNHPAVAQRVVTLRNAAAAGDPALSAQALIADLEAMVDVDPATLMDVRSVPCGACWPDDVLAAAMVRAYATQTDLPDSNEPRDDCPACAGSGRLVGAITATAELPLAARRLVKGIEFYDGGGVKKVIYHDQATLRTELHKLKGMHVDRSISLNLNADVKPLKRGMSVEEALQLMESVAPTEADPIDAEFTEVSTEP